MTQNEMDVKDQHRYGADKQWKRKIGDRNIERWRLISHLDQHKLIGGDQEIKEEEPDEEFPGKEDRLLNLLRQPVEDKLDDDERSPFIHSRSPDEDDITDQEHRQFQNPWERPIEEVAADDLQHDDENKHSHEKRAQP